MPVDTNPYLPELVTITNIIEETPNIKSFQVVFDDPGRMKTFRFEPGQVGQLSVFGVGESTFVINLPPTPKKPVTPPSTKAVRRRRPAESRSSKP